MTAGNGLHFGGEKARAMSRRAHLIAHQIKVDAFAELLAEGKSVPDASAILGEHQSWGNNALQAMRRKLGPQAC